MHQFRQVIWMAVIAAAALAGGLWVGDRWQGDTTPPALERATALGEQARPLPPFELVRHDGAPLVPESFIGAWSIIFFGYTHCPDVCPVTLSAVKQALDSLPETVASTPIQVYFISVDPERDSPARLKEYVTYFDPDFLAGTGTPEQLARLTRGVGIVYARSPAPPGGDPEADYLVDHSASMLLINPRGELHAVFSPPHEGPVLARDLMKIVDSYQPS